MYYVYVIQSEKLQKKSIQRIIIAKFDTLNLDFEKVTQSFTEIWRFTEIFW